MLRSLSPSKRQNKIRREGRKKEEVNNLIGIHGYNLVGYSLVEVPVIDPLFDTQATKELAKKYGLQLSCSVGLSEDTDISSLDESVRKQGEQVLMTAVERAHTIGSSIVCGVIYSKLGKYHRAATRQNVENSVEILRRVAQKAQSWGVQLGLEVCNKYETNLINTAGDALKMIEAIGMPNVVVHLDAYHMNIDENDPIAAIYSCHNRLGYFHIGESHRGYLGTGNISLRNMFRALAQVGYSGPLVFESFSNAIVSPFVTEALAIWRNQWEDGEEVAKHALAFVQSECVCLFQVTKWYSDTTSQWTLDYPPLFACLEWFLAQLVAIVDKHLVQLDQLQITTLVDVWVMRSTVILCDLCLAHAGYLHLSILRKYQPQVSDIQLSIMFSIFVLQPSLFMVDHIHFQYNGFLIACLFYVSYYYRMGKSISFLSSIALLVLLKQTFLYIVPISLFAITCQRYAQYKKGGFISFCILFIQSSLLLMLFLSIGIFPWLYDWQQLKILTNRLFPFERGLLHAYWAPHFWSIYGCLDQNISTRGWIGIRKPFVLLPNPSPWICHGMVVLGMLPSFYDLWKRRHLLLHPMHSMWLWMFSIWLACS
ncbi:D-tagatose 3-epimerase [Galdieria sulphuraria]|nr:D-tagatose 3-epimerase [Galdieria sulphuraria]